MSRQTVQKPESMPESARSKRCAFTLIEVLVVVAIIALLTAILIPTLARAREQSRRVVCASNLHQHMLAITMYANDNKGNYPLNPSQCLKNNGTISWWVDTVVATYDPPGGRPPFDLRAMFRRYVGRQNEAFSCPSNGGPRMDDKANLDYVAANGYMGAHIMMFWNSVCVFKGTKPANSAGAEIAWAPRPEWQRGGTLDTVPLVQDEFNAIGSSPTKLDLFYYNHGYSAERSNFNGCPSYTNYKVSGNRADCTGVNIGFLDSHVSWIKNVSKASGWVLDVPYSGSTNRVGGSLDGSGSPLTFPKQIIQH